MLKPIKNWITIIAYLFAIQTICRVIFIWFNSQFFSDLRFFDLIIGLRFDLVATSYLFLLFLLSYYTQSVFKLQWVKKYLTPVLFQIGLQLTLLSNLIDVIYYNFTFKRTTADIFDLVGTGNDVARLIPQFLKDYWYVVLLYLLLTFVLTKIFNKINHIPQLNNRGWKKWGLNGFGLIALLMFIVVGARGGLQLRPLSLVDTARYETGPESAVILNTPFSIILSIQAENEKPVKYFSEEELSNIYSPVQTVRGTGSFKGKNVVLIIMESFAEEYIGYLSGKPTYTPFLDSLFAKSLVFKNNRANGLKSIEALPSVLAGIPSLMNTSYTLSPYASNQITSLPKELKKLGYSTSFFHAGENGTFAFDAFCLTAGIDEYYGLNQYPEKLKARDYDGNWGIFDEPYFQYYAKELNKLKTPFFSTIFSLSSHHPYSIPKQYENTFKKGPLVVHETIGYSDNALRQFFKTAQQQPWYNNTIFVITADHPAQSQYPFYLKNSGRYKVPLAFFDPSGELKGIRNHRTQHADLPSSILSLVTDSARTLNFGRNIFSDTTGFVVNYKSNSYLISNNQYAVVFDGEAVRGVYLNSDSLWLTNLVGTKEVGAEELIKKGKAYIQQYKNRIIQNKLIERGE